MHTILLRYLHALPWVAPGLLAGWAIVYLPSGIDWLVWALRGRPAHPRSNPSSIATEQPALDAPSIKEIKR